MIPLKKPNLRRCFNFPAHATYDKYVSVTGKFCALHLGLFERNHVSGYFQRNHVMILTFCLQDSKNMKILFFRKDKE
jgi:hypothetical protein